MGSRFSGRSQDRRQLRNGHRAVAVDPWLYFFRFLHYTSSLQLFGVAVFQAWIAPPELQRAMSKVSVHVAIASATVFLVSGVGWLLVVAGSMGSGWADTV